MYSKLCTGVCLGRTTKVVLMYVCIGGTDVRVCVPFWKGGKACGQHGKHVSLSPLPPTLPPPWRKGEEGRLSRLFQSSVPDDRPVPTPCKWQVGKVQPGRTAAGQARQVVLAAPPLLRLAREEGSLQLSSRPVFHPVQKRWSRLKRGGGRGSFCLAFPIPEIANRRGESSPRALRSPPLDVTTTHCARTPNHGEPVERSSSTNRRSATHGCVRVHARSSRKRRERDAGGCEERQLQLQARRRAANGRRGSRARAGLILAPPGCLR